MPGCQASGLEGREIRHPDFPERLYGLYALRGRLPGQEQDGPDTQGPDHGPGREDS